MNTVQRIMKNAGASLFTRIANPAITFILVFFIARFLGVSGLGKFSSALSMFYIFQALSSFGFSYLVTREVAQDKSKAGKYLVNASLLALFLSILMAVIMCLTINYITDVTDIIHSVYILSIALVPSALSQVCQSISRAFEKLEYIAISEIIGNVFKVLLGLFILFKGYGLVKLMLVVLGAHFLAFFLSIYLASQCIPKLSFTVDFTFCKNIFKAAPVFAFILILNTVRWNIDTLILTNMMGATEVGFYNAAYKLFNICKLGIGCYIMAVQPIIFRLFITSLKKFKTAGEDSIRYLLILAIPIVIGTTLLSENFILFIFKPDFLPAANVLRIIVWIMFFSGANLIYANALVASNNQKINFQGNLVSMITNICLNLILIPKLSFIGAGIASIISSFTLFSFQHYFVSRHLFKVNYFHIAAKPFIAATIMGISILLLRDINLILLIFISMIIYLIGLLLLKAFSPGDITIMRELLKGKGDFDSSESQA